MGLKERCLEMDLYWFQKGELHSRVKELFQRVTPLFTREQDGMNGISLCVGWLFDSVLYWQGNLSDKIVTCQPPTYQEWSYGQLKQLIVLLRQEAAVRGIPNFYCAISLLGGETMAYDAEHTCEGWSGRTQETTHRAHYNIHGKWFFEHPEINKQRLGIFDFHAQVALPQNEVCSWEASPTFLSYFAQKLTDMSRAVGLDGVVLRDGVFAPSYIRGADVRYKPSEKRREITDCFIELFSEIKRLLPNYRIIGYNSGTSSMEQLRSHGFDLEAVAASGKLDLWITQTWASAWQDYWPANGMGFTFQLQAMLTEQAMLSKTPCRHMFLVETFDAWEPWDSIHSYPDKVAWEMWAYSHAGVLEAEKTQYADGCYISWMNRGETLIPQATVESIQDTLNMISENLEDAPKPGGACILYSRKGMIDSMDQGGDTSRGEEFDDWCAMIQKYGVSIVSAVRSEDLETAPEAECYLCPTVCSQDPQVEAFLLRILQSKIPVLFMGVADMLAPKVRDLVGISVHAVDQKELPQAGMVSHPGQKQVRTEAVVMNQYRQSMDFSEVWEPIITVSSGPVLAVHRQLPIAIWETPEWGTPRELHLTFESVQSPQTYLLVAEIVKKWCQVKWENADQQKPVNLLYWNRGEKAEVLLGNLETGYLGNSQFAAKGRLQYPPARRLRNQGEYALGKLYDESSGQANAAVAPHRISKIDLL